MAFWIISGPTSVGKSSFIMSPRCSEITGLPSDTSVVWASREFRLDEVDSPDAFFHYNILRYARIALKNGEDVGRNASRFDRDVPWISLLNRAAEKRAVVLVTSKQTIKDRIAQRTVGEEPELKGYEAKGGYPARRWLKLIEQVDLPALYNAWCQELRNQQIPYVLVNSNDNTFPVIEDEACLPDIISGEAPASATARKGAHLANGESSAYSQEQVMELLRAGRFGYHRIELPYGLHTRGQDRGATRDLVLPESLVGKSVLDVGSALGYFCFEAEARGATRVLGVELRDDRFQDALLLKAIKGSDVEFIQRDVVLNPLEEQFDYVLLLNVLHHLYEPFRALRQLASITKERLVLEFPTLADRKFQASLDVELPPECDRLPLVGVSSMRPGVRETFVYTPSAIQRVLIDHERLFDEVEIVGSPMPGRAIAICHKRPSNGKEATDQQRRTTARQDAQRESDGQGCRPGRRRLAVD